jgi:hypothetical protein
MHVPVIKCCFHKKSENLETMSNCHYGSFDTSNHISPAQENIAALFTCISPSIDNLRTWYRHLAACYFLQEREKKVDIQLLNRRHNSDGNSGDGTGVQFDRLSAALRYKVTKALDESLDDQMAFWRTNPNWVETKLVKYISPGLTLAHPGSTAAVGANTSQCVATATDVQAADATATTVAAAASNVPAAASNVSAAASNAPAAATNVAAAATTVAAAVQAAIHAAAGRSLTITLTIAIAQ